jgi:predicted small secreted protein
MVTEHTISGAGYSVYVGHLGRCSFTRRIVYNFFCKEIIMKAIIGIMLIVSLSACSTVAGVGKDIQDSATWTKEKMSGSGVKL